MRGRRVFDVHNFSFDLAFIMKSHVLNIVKRAPYLSLLMTAAALLIHIFHPIRPHLLYTRTGLAQGEFWRLFACHWVHLNTDHLLWSAATFLVLGSFCEIMDRGKYILVVGISVICTPLIIWVILPHLNVYGGLSGLDCALYSLLTVLFIKRERQLQKWGWVVFYTLMLVLLPTKIIYEMTSGLTVFVNSSHTAMVPVPLAHLVGGGVGFAVGTLQCNPIFSRFRLANIRFSM